MDRRAPLPLVVVLLMGLGACGPVYRAAATTAPVGHASALILQAVPAPPRPFQLSRAWRSSAQ
jgi:hypothetical protein